jgi:arsenite methyltransferase
MAQLQDRVREKYGAIASFVRTSGGCGAGACCGGDPITSNLYTEAETQGLPPEALSASLGCGNPTALLSLSPGQVVLDLGSGGGIDVLLSAKRVGPSGRVYGVDMTDEMLALARRNADTRGATNVEFRKGRLEALPVEDASVDLVISNCVINLVPDKAAAFAEIARVLVPGGSVSLSDLVLLGPLPEAVRQDVEAYVGCVAGASPLGTYPAGLLEAGLVDVSIPRIVNAGLMVEGLHGALPAADVAQAARVLASAVFHAILPGAIAAA